jgi:hypothetical protein
VPAFAGYVTLSRSGQRRTDLPSEWAGERRGWTCRANLVVGGASRPSGVLRTSPFQRNRRLNKVDSYISLEFRMVAPRAEPCRPRLRLRLGRWRPLQRPVGGRPPLHTRDDWRTARRHEGADHGRGRLPRECGELEDSAPRPETAGHAPARRCRGRWCPRVLGGRPRRVAEDPRAA